MKTKKKKKRKKKKREKKRGTKRAKKIMFQERCLRYTKVVCQRKKRDCGSSSESVGPADCD